MSAPHEKLADSLRVLQQTQADGRTVFQSTEFSRTHRERLVSNGFLQEVVKGWYMLSNPAERNGESTGWYASFFTFVAAYCNERFGADWHLSPEASLAVYTRSTAIPSQVLVYAKAGKNNNLSLRYGTSIFDYKTPAMPAPSDIAVVNGLRLLTLPLALVKATPTLFVEKALDMQVALSQITDVSDVLSKLLDGGQSVVAGRIAGAFRAAGRAEDADRIVNTLKLSGYQVTEQNPFAKRILSDIPNAEGPCSTRIRLMWAEMREAIISAFPSAPGLPSNIAAYLADVDERHIEDAYHSLSIEGYQVSEELIAKIAAGSWTPAANEQDKQDRNALAAKGYNLAFQQVRASVSKILEGAEPGAVTQKAHHDWYMHLFSPSVGAGLLEAKHLAGYRSWPVYIRNARHVPPSKESLREAMPTLFKLISSEPEASVRAVLGHFIFVYIHPYGDGNGRIGRFLMNTMLASGGYPWTVVRVTTRDEYMNALEDASVKGNIQPFAEFIGNCVRKQLAR
ncbi:MAG: Fic family protein [Sulfuricellaceae bacterium]|nr:Fic family protein [Sulfuricellaceae bacterium]